MTGTHKCSLHADCLNTKGSYKCRCKSGFRGNGFECTGETKNCITPGREKRNTVSWVDQTTLKKKKKTFVWTNSQVAEAE